jgi:hypothetical protein
MSYRPLHYSHSTPISQQQSEISALYRNHGQPRPQQPCPFLSIPKESITHVTSYLDPQSLLLLGQVNWSLYDHIKDDHTWRRAFAANCLGIAPDKDLETEQTTALLFRRTESSWRKEYIVHYVLSEYAFYCSPHAICSL